MKNLPAPKRMAGADKAPASTPRRQHSFSLAERVARLAWMECADGATRRDLAASAARKAAADKADKAD
ncbi:hypothetical protein GE253_18155 [Niveispirillum sp. SYP-B3756]|uniref:hypothetical protein n=1 Tax=Niveispirillum sp. SYP-B3756 TaxID=2662178 RepID=UPI001290D978|nr:hypothetical protein [Niveispirillum sp. SYP-B3756]MQP67252.1 hypothetical protein [Niveispirillum sp. SYP-B3756]